MALRLGHRGMMVTVIVTIVVIMAAGTGALYLLSRNDGGVDMDSEQTDSAIVTDGPADDRPNGGDTPDRGKDVIGDVDGTGDGRRTDATGDVTATVQPDTEDAIDDVFMRGDSDDGGNVDSDRVASEFASHPDTGYANMLTDPSGEAGIIARYAFGTMDQGTLRHTDAITRRDGGLTYLTRTYTGRLNDGRDGTLTVDVIRETETGRLVYALLTGFQASEQLPSGGTKVEDMLVSGV